MWTYVLIFFYLSVCLQTGEYATDEEEEMSPVFPNSIEVFDLAENQDMLSPVELDPEKLAHKFKEVYMILKIDYFVFLQRWFCFLTEYPSWPVAPN